MITTTDSIEVSLLTCSPGEEIYSLYGHTALRYKNTKTGEDWAFNYGMFSFKKPFFALRFTLGLTDYELGAIPFDIFKKEYERNGRGIVEQTLNMTSKEKRDIYNALKNNFLPENRVYRYNFFYDNCTTRARDMIERCIDGKIIYADTKKYGTDNLYPTYREAIHEHTIGHKWAEFGNDLCIGAKADIRMNLREQQFIPEYLKNDFYNAQIKSPDGICRPLVKSSETIVSPRVHIIKEEFPFSPIQCTGFLFLISAVIAFIEYKRGKTFIAWDCLLMFVNGIAGIILFVLLFSEHPTTSTNMQVLLINPIPLFFIYNVARRKKTVYWKLSFCMIILFIIGSFLQNYAEGIYFVALSLLTRCWIHLRRSKSTTDNK